MMLEFRGEPGQEKKEGGQNGFIIVLLLWKESIK